MTLWNLQKLSFEWIHCSSCFLKRKPKKTCRVLLVKIITKTVQCITKGSIFLQEMERYRKVFGYSGLSLRKIKIYSNYKISPHKDGKIQGENVIAL